MIDVISVQYIVPHTRKSTVFRVFFVLRLRLYRTPVLFISLEAINNNICRCNLYPSIVPASIVQEVNVVDTGGNEKNKWLVGVRSAAADQLNVNVGPESTVNFSVFVWGEVVELSHVETFFSFIIHASVYLLVMIIMASACLYIIMLSVCHNKSNSNSNKPLQDGIVSCVERKKKKWTTNLDCRGATEGTA
jgi:hypothetical protein